MLDYPGFITIIIIMQRKNLKTGQIIKTNCYFHHKQLFQIIGFTPKRVKVIRISDGNKYSWFIKENTITEIVQ